MWFLEGDAIPELSFALIKSLLSSAVHCIIAFRASAVGVVLECSSWGIERGTEVQAGKEGF